MEFILSELRGNGVVINEHVFKYQMNKIIENCGESYEELMSRVAAEEEDLKDIFYATNINSDGRVMSFLALLYYKRQRGVDIGEPIRLLVNVLKLNFGKKSFWQRVVLYIGPILVCVLTHDFVKKF